MQTTQTGRSRTAGRLLRAASLAAIAAATALPLAAQAQDTAGEEAGVEAVVVTASRVQAAGFTAPTPTTVLGAQDVQKVAPLQVTDALSLMPAFRFSTQSSSASQYANLRNIGATRTLVLVNGRRHVPTQPDGTFDLNMIPSSLVERTEVVTGGASASWGSDAVAGVVNLILNNRLQGVQGNIQGGISDYGDAKTYAFSLAAGTSFAGGRGHIVAGGEYVRDKGVRDLQPPYFSRPWAVENRGNLANAGFATNGLPGVLYSTGVRRAATSAGGLITNGPLRGQNFQPDGTLRQFGFGTVYGNNMIGGTDNIGENLSPGSDVRYPYERYTFLTHAEYELSPAVTAFLEGSYAHSLTKGSYTNTIRFEGATTGAASCTATTAATALGGIAVPITNPYLSASARAAMTGAGVNCILVGKTFREWTSLGSQDGSPWVWRGVGGFRGDLGGWKWNAYYQYGENRSQQVRIGNLNMANFRQAIDAVQAPNGQIVCRSTLANPGNGCVPLNILGAGGLGSAAEAYVRGTSKYVAYTKQQVAAFDVQRDLFDIGAGAFTLAAGGEYRKEELNATTDAVSAVAGWQTGNRAGAAGSYDVKEGFAELVAPLLKDQAFFQSLTVNGAVRYTDYSSSGGVTTWKVGGTWDINDELRLRGTRSRDIRAGNLSELFTPTAIATAAGLRNPITGGSGPAQVITTGNPTLAPEKADTLTFGVVYQPNWASGLRMSVDYYKIRINGAIGSLTAQQVIDRCFLDKVQELCGLVQTDAAGVVTRVTTPQLNLNRVDTAGVDAEISYRMPMSRLHAELPGTLNARLLANYVDKIATTAAVNGRVTDPAGQYTTPHWTLIGVATYDVGRFSGTVDLRFYGGGNIDNTLTLGGLSATGINVNHVGRVLYTNLAFSYDIKEGGRAQIYGRINNLWNSWPPFPSNGGGVFDEIGRAYRVGLRFKY
jgi:outer membrane receptor protein involved in Fe transport